jgi:hypothetical protein
MSRDSLCIKQPITGPGVNAKDSESDWLEQSRWMDKIYQKSFLNVSATASLDGDQGLFRTRFPEYLWEDEINLNPVGTNSIGADRRVEANEDRLTRCTIIDVSFWDDLVEQAPVNRRAWVLQERIMCPRVLHFCKDQIAWECAEFQRAEGHPEGLPTWRKKLGEIVDEGLFKGLSMEDGLRLRRIRLKGCPDPDTHIPNLYVYELWKRIVEAYSKMKLTVSRDKLIALSGIAKRFSEDTQCRYIAGMWLNYLESQLLWQVEDLFKDGMFENQSKRDPSRAPSFSWASLDTPHGLTYGEATDYEPHPDKELFFRVVKHNIVLADDKNEFGLIKEGQLWLKVQHLRRIRIHRLEPPFRVPFSWQLYETDPTIRHGNARMGEYYNMYLDAPESDRDIFEEEAELYCMAAAYGERTVKQSSRSLICLLLKLRGFREDGCREFKRIGLTKLSNYWDDRGQKALREARLDETICLC